MPGLSTVNVLDKPGLYEVTSSSATVYYVDTRPSKSGPRYMRWRGVGITPESHMDHAWHPLVMLTSRHPEIADGSWLKPWEMDLNDTAEWTLRVGCGHVYDTYRDSDHPNGPLYWVYGRPCEEIRRLEAMPPEAARARRDAWL